VVVLGETLMILTEELTAHLPMLQLVFTLKQPEEINNHGS
jgi:hypothetical protein